MTKRVVLIGHPVAHSLSGAMQQAAFDSPGIAATYDLGDRYPIEVALTRIRVLASSASMMESCQGIALSSMCAALRPKCFTRPSARCRWRLNTMIRWKPSVMSP